MDSRADALKVRRPVTRSALTAEAPAALLMMVGLRPFVPI